MLNLYELTQELKRLSSENKHEDALQFYKEHHKNYEKEIIASNGYLVAEILKCLRKTNKGEKAIEYLQYLNIEINEKTHESILNSYGWVLYSLLKSIEPQGDDEENENYDSLVLVEEPIPKDLTETEKINDINLFEKIKIIVPILDKKSKFSPFKRLFRLVLKSEKAKVSPNWKHINDFLDVIDYSKLSQEPDNAIIQRRGKEKEIELASDFEKWFFSKSKALNKLGKHENCIEISTKALDEIKTFHHNIDTWLNRLIAISYSELGKVDEAINFFRKVLRRKNDWFIFSELGDLFANKGELENSAKHLVFGLLSYGDLDKKVGLIFNIGLVLKRQQNNKKALEHFILSKMIREEQNWKVPEPLKKEITELSISNQSPSEEFSSSLFEKLKPFWYSICPEFKYAGARNLKGEVVMLNRGKGFGFIKISEGESFYFKLHDYKNHSINLEQGNRVTFNVQYPRELGKAPKAYQIR